MAAIFLLLVVGVVTWLFYSSATNPADSGEGGVLLVFFAMPWIEFVPTRFLGPAVAALCILLNALLIYFICGGLRIEKTPGPD